MRRITKHALVGAAIGCLIVTIFATGEMLGHPDAPPTPVVVLIALAMGGLVVGVPAGGVVGGVIGLVRHRRQAQHEEAEVPQPSYATATGSPATGSPGTGPPPTAGSTPPSRAPAAPLQHDPAARSAARERVATASQQQAQRQGHAPPAPLAPVAPAPQRAPAPERVDQSDPERLNKVLARLDELIGLESVAGQVREYAQRVAFEQQRAEVLDTDMSEIGMHALFVGPPGVAKTTVARIWAEALCALGMLPTDRLVEVSRKDLVGEVVGATAKRTREKLEESKGGVFFLDEAYALAPGTQQDFGPEAVTEILAYMENHRSEFCLIAAGYEDKMEQFLDTNPGLASRFSERVEFAAYDAPTLVEITATIAAEGRDEITDEGRQALQRAYQRLTAAPPKNFANGRSARDVLGAARTARAVRLGPGQHDHESLTVLTAEDMQTGVSRKFPQAV